MLKCYAPANWIGDFSRCLYDWQGLEAGLLAVLAAGFSVWFLQKQIKQAQEHRNDELARKHNAARLTLPLALSAVAELVQKIAAEVASEFEKFGPDGFSKTFDAILEDAKPRSKFDPMALPSDVIRSFEDFVASLANPHDIKHVAELMGSIQLLLSRYNDFNLKQAGQRLGLIDLLLDAAKVNLLNEKMFNYARFADDGSFGIVGIISTTEAWDQVHGRAQNLVFRRDSPDIFFGDFKASIERKKKTGASPWIEKFKPLVQTGAQPEPGPPEPVQAS